MSEKTSSTPYVSLTAWATPKSVNEDAMTSDPVGRIAVVIPHGKGTRMVTIEVGLDECLALCANAADAARLLAPWRTTR